MLRDSVVVVVVVVVVRKRPRAISLAMITIRKSFMGFLFFPVMTMGLRLAALRAAGAPLLIRKDREASNLPLCYLPGYLGNCIYLHIVFFALSG